MGWKKGLVVLESHAYHILEHMIKICVASNVLNKHDFRVIIILN